MSLIVKCRYILCLLAVFILSACQTNGPAPEAAAEDFAGAKIVDLKNNTTISAAEMVARLRQVDYVLIGEEHDVIKHHQIESWLAGQLAGGNASASFTMEMLSSDKQHKISKVKQWLQTNQSTRAVRIAELIDWDRRWNLDLYGAFLAVIMKSPNQLFGGNLTQQEITNGCTTLKQLEGQNSVNSQVQGLIRQAVQATHATDEATVNCQILIQQHKDRRMAQTMLAASKPNILYAGNFHVNKLIGVPLHLKDLEPTAKYLVVMLSTDSGNLNFEQADFVWPTNR